MGRILRILTEKVKVSWVRGLPDELCQIIAGFLVRECAVITAEELANQNSVDNSVLDLSQDVYGRYVVIDGVRYIKSLRNASGSIAEPGEELLLDTHMVHNIRNIHIGEDHLGVRHVQFSPSMNVSRSHLSIPGLWWRQLSESCGISKIPTRTDVSSKKRVEFYRA